MIADPAWVRWITIGFRLLKFSLLLLATVTAFGLAMALVVVAFPHFLLAAHAVQYIGAAIVGGLLLLMFSLWTITEPGDIGDLNQNAAWRLIHLLAVPTLAGLWGTVSLLDTGYMQDMLCVALFGLVSVHLVGLIRLRSLFIAALDGNMAVVPSCRPSIRLLAIVLAVILIVSIMVRILASGYPAFDNGMYVLALGTTVVWLVVLVQLGGIAHRMPKIAAS